LRHSAVGAVAALITVQTNLTIVMATGLLGRFWLAAIAGYGTGSRLEYLLVPIVFGFGGPFVALVVESSTVVQWASPAGR
jgi:MATE family, multidrug efflux pump